MGFLDRIKNIARANNTAKKVNTDEINPILSLRVGDVISIFETDYEVEGAIKYNDSGWRWTEYKLKDAHKTYWLSVEKDDDIEVSLFEEVVALTVDAPRVFEYKNITYYMQEGSDAIVEQVSGNINLTTGEVLDYYEYCDEDGEHLLTIEIWDGEVEMSIGRSIEEYNIEIFPSA